LDTFLDYLVSDDGGTKFVEVEGHTQEGAGRGVILFPGLDLVECAYYAQTAGEDGRRIAAHLGQNVLHQREMDDRLAKSKAVAGVTPGDDIGPARIGRAADGVEDARRVDDVSHHVAEAAFQVADVVGHGVAELDLAGRQRARAQLVLQAADVHMVEPPVVQAARYEEEAEAVGALPLP